MSITLDTRADAAVRDELSLGLVPETALRSDSSRCPDGIYIPSDADLSFDELVLNAEAMERLGLEPDTAGMPGFLDQQWDEDFTGLMLAEAQANLTTLLESGDESGLSSLTVIRDILRNASTGASEAACISRISVLEDIKSAAAAAQARETTAFLHHRAVKERAAGVPIKKRGLGVGSEIALARRESPQAGSRAVRMAHTLTTDMPNALAALTDGRLAEFTAQKITSEVTALDPPAIAAIDTRMAGRYGKAGTKRITGEVRALANQIDPAAQVKRHKIAKSRRSVTVRPAPDAMAYLTALLPMGQAFACKKALLDAAATAKNTGWADGDELQQEERSGTQIEADLLVERLTGQATPDAIPIELQIIMTDTSVFGITSMPGATSTHDPDATGTKHSPRPDQNTNDPAATHGASGTNDLADTDDSLFPVVDDDGRRADPAHTAAWIAGLGPIPAPLARDMLNPAYDDPATRRSRVFLRRVVTDPVTGDITAIDTRQRAFSGALRRALLVRDSQCRTPWCNAPIAHMDHTHPFASGGHTTLANGSGLCARCNYTKEYPGWNHQPGTGPSASNGSPAGSGNRGRPPAESRSSDRIITTPTGHHYHSTAPPITPNLNRRQ
ncbi:MAG: DUF222 domain-containing protein [Ancrocorticia sp.]|uniref:HNH endonuclease n=1 Tax=Ancrocorticia sp. TaxID=2593684 RepID=UPI003F8FBFE5